MHLLGDKPAAVFLHQGWIKFTYFTPGVLEWLEILWSRFKESISNSKIDSGTFLEKTLFSFSAFFGAISGGSFWWHV